MLQFLPTLFTGTRRIKTNPALENLPLTLTFQKMKKEKDLLLLCLAQLIQQGLIAMMWSQQFLIWRLEST
jgi:hypothetical protein